MKHEVFLDSSYSLEANNGCTQIFGFWSLAFLPLILFLLSYFRQACPETYACKNSRVNFGFAFFFHCSRAANRTVRRHNLSIRNSSRPPGVACVWGTMAMNEDFNFAELCRLCSLKSSHHIQIFDKEGEQQQLLFKLHSCIPAVVSISRNI